MPLRLLSLLAMLMALVLPAQADLWSGFYTSTAPAKPTEPVLKQEQRQEQAAIGTCLAAILQAEARHGIPDNLLLSIGLQEAGRRAEGALTVWPWTVNANGEGAFFADKAKAMAWVREKQAAGINSIDVGCMQINLRWHGEAFADLPQAFDPIANVDYAARFLLRLYRREGSWQKAAGKYHSSTEKYQKIYLAGLARNQQVAKARLAELIARAGTPALPAPVQLAEVRPKAPPPPVFWGSDQDETGTTTYSIYSTEPLRAVLPGFKDMF